MFSLSLSMNKMEKKFVPYQEALALKEFGFDEPCFGFYRSSEDIMPTTKLITRISSIKNLNNRGMRVEVLAPTFSQAFRWFREKYGLKHDIDDDNVGTKFYYKIRSYTDKFDNYDDIIKPMREEKDWAKIEFKTYEEADLACLIKLIEIVKNK